MNLERAIEILTNGLPADTWKLQPELKDAINLGIEALEEKLEREKRGEQ